ncbi:transmembrane protein 169 isoform X1 [Eupeodes corollae]|uniref:transmembrane protein 169 isoform X1 n=1 Tax=Eupeodes corollae TaxID=290404 RepID=UPI002492CB10|nr:transmembrane protein 169 isoform X1 [Eupeodes corollae]
MVGKTLLSTEANMLKERPVFIPPRKRQTSKKTNGTQNYVDHIVAVQNRQKVSPSSPGLEDDLLKTSLILKNKQPLPQIPLDETKLSTTQLQIKPISASSDNIYEGEESELQHFENLPPVLLPSTRRESSTVTPSSYSESSLDAKLSKSQDCLSTRSSKKRVNIRTDIKHVRNSNRNSPEIANYEDLESGETSVLNGDDFSLERFNTKRSVDSHYLTMTGTIKRGRKKGQCVDLQINISRAELEQINAVAIATETKKKANLWWTCSLTTGLHIFILSMISLPFVILFSAVYSFYIGTLTWYNVFNYFNEEKGLAYKFFVSPLLVLTYPVGIIICTIGLGIYAGVVQISLQFNSWLNEVGDIEKGFYGWLCAFLHLSDCSPYEVVILTDIRMPDEHPHANTSTEELSL